MSAGGVVFIVDDDSSVLKALARLVASSGYEPRTFSSPRAFLEQYDARIAGCLVLDVAMPGLDGLQLQHALGDPARCPPIVFLTGKGDIPTSVKAIRQGAVDFLTKPVDGDTLLSAIGKAMGLDQTSRVRRSELQSIEARLATLTPREREVLEQVASGRLNKQIAADLGTSEKTVKVHRGRMMEKMGVGSVAELARLMERAETSRPR